MCVLINIFVAFSLSTGSDTPVDVEVLKCGSEIVYVKAGTDMRVEIVDSFVGNDDRLLIVKNLER